MATLKIIWDEHAKTEGSDRYQALHTYWWLRKQVKSSQNEVVITINRESQLDACQLAIVNGLFTSASFHYTNLKTGEQETELFDKFGQLNYWPPQTQVRARMASRIMKAERELEHKELSNAYNQWKNE